MVTTPMNRQRYGFNCGSTLGMSESAGRLAAQVAMNTTLSPAISGLIVTFTMRCTGLLCKHTG